MPVTDSFIASMIHTCTRRAFTATGVDGGGLETGSFADNGTGIVCRIEPLFGSSREVYIDTQLFLADFILYLLPDQGLEMNDKIIGTTSPFTDTYEVLKIADAPNGSDIHHREVVLRVAK